MRETETAALNAHFRRADAWAMGRRTYETLLTRILSQLRQNIGEVGAG